MPTVNATIQIQCDNTKNERRRLAGARAGDHVCRRIVRQNHLPLLWPCILPRTGEHVAANLVCHARVNPDRLFVDQPSRALGGLLLPPASFRFRLDTGGFCLLCPFT
ncbi:hypothetical protein KBK24_0120465 [Burkholderia sp. K24]|nr:hypothetical protein KBK24_0120465 [Burkholderia sp. K24]